MSKGSAIPVRFDPEVEAQLNALSEKTGITKSEIIRRAVHFLLAEVKRRGGKLGWLVDEDFETPAPGRALITTTAAPFDPSVAARYEALLAAEEGAAAKKSERKPSKMPPSHA